ncbi:MAG TPA: hypothetical protein VIL20_29430, partial [Sandaracinaceae bacterium]
PMNRTGSFAITALASFLLALGCDGTPDPEADAGADSGAGQPDAGRDAGPPPPEDAGPPPDGGPTGCTEGCAFVELALGSSFTCARRENGEVWCWGRNQEGQLGTGRRRHSDCAAVGSEPVDCSGVAVPVRALEGGSVVQVRDAIAMSARGGSTCIVREGRGVWCWGFEGTPPPGGGMPAIRLEARAIAGFESADGVANAHHHICALYAEDGHAVCFGYNGDGQLGLGHREDPIPMPRGSVLGEGGAGTLTGIVELVGSSFATTCARTDTGVYCWGNNDSNQFGDGLLAHDAERCGGTMITSYDCSSTPVRVGDPSEPLTDVAQLALGSQHACALGNDGVVRCWGDNRAGQAGQPPSMSTVPLPTEVPGMTGVTQIATTSRFTCALKSDGTVWCWGYNLHGQLGDGIADHGVAGSSDNCTPTTSESGDCSGDPVQVAGIDDATHIGTGGSHACAIRASGELWCWGYNDTRQLGNNSRETSFTPVRVIGLPD